MKQYDKSLCYKLKVINTYIDNENYFYIVEDTETRYKVRLFDFQKKQKQPSTIFCKVTAFEADGSPIFEQDRYRLLSTLYKTGEIYSFRVGNRNESMHSENDFYFLYDNYGFSFKLPVWKREYIQENQRICCQIMEIYNNGSIKLKPEAGYVFLKSNFLPYEQLLQNIGLTDTSDEISLEALKEKREENGKINNLFVQYEQANGLWVISYMSIITSNRRKAINEENYPLVNELNLLYCSIAEWVIENSDFLSVYSPDMIDSLHLKIEEELELSKLQIYTFNLIQTNQGEEYFSKIINNIKVSGYLCNKQTRIKTIFQILHFLPDLLDNHPEDFLFFAYYLSKGKNKDHIQSVQKIINKFITQKGGDMNVFLNFENIDKDFVAQIWIVVRYIAASFLLGTKGKDIRYLRSMLYRYLTILEKPENRPAFIRKSINALFATEGYSPEFEWGDILHYNHTSLTAKISSFINSKETYFDGEQLFTSPYGCIKINSQKTTIYPREYAFSPLSEAVTLYENQVGFCIPKKEKKSWVQTSDLGKQRLQWDFLHSLFKYTPPPATTAKEELQPGTSVLVRIQGFNKNYPLMVFADIVDQKYKGTGVLHVTNIARYYIPSLGNMFFPNDEFRVTVSSAKEGKIQFSLLEEFDQIAASNLLPGDHVTAKLVRTYKNNLIWVNRNGYVFYTEKTEDYKFHVGISAELLIDGIMADNRILATFIEETDAEIDETEALKSIIQEYISYSQADESRKKAEELENRKNVEIEKNNCSQFINTEFLKELIFLNFLSISCLSDPVERYQYIATARLLSQLAGYKSQMDFFQQYMNYEEALYHFLYDPATISTPLKFTIKEDHAKESFPVMKHWMQIIEILNCWDNPETENTLYAQTNNENPLSSALSRLVLSHNMLKNTTVDKNTLLALKAEIAHLLNMDIKSDHILEKEKEEEKLVNLGLEDGEKEFKTSLVYPAGSSHSPNMSLQTKTILKTITGFLNAKGGTLFLGVHDTGDVIGLKSDFEYLKCGADEYERSLRSRIVHSLGKDINGQITFKFVTYKNRMICEIRVPDYPQLVSLDGIVWQRQGNETRMIEGMSLLLLEKRKQQEKEQAKAQQAENPKPMVSKAETKEKNERKAGYSIPTSMLRANPSDSDDMSANNIAYWSILETNEYIITDDYPRMSGILCTIAIQEHELDHYFVLGYENGYVNKVAIKTILSKKRKYAYKNGKVKNLPLMFVSIASDADALFIRTLKNGTEFYKLFPVNGLKPHIDMSHKGSPIFSFNFGTMLQWDVIPEASVYQLDRLQNSLPTYQGISANSNGFNQEMQFISEKLLQK